MYVEDQDEDVEEEEEFHEAEEDKLKSSSQESVGCSTAGDNKSSSVNSCSPTSLADISNDKQQHEQSQEPEEKATTVTEQQNNVEKVIEQSDVDTKLELDSKSDSKQDEIKSGEAVDQVKEPEAEESSQSSQDKTTETQTSDTPNVEAVSDSRSYDVEHHLEKAAPQTKTNDKNIDWANIMLNSNSINDSDSVGDTLSSDKALLVDEDPQPQVTSADADDTIDGIIKETQEKLKITDETDDSVILNQRPDEKSIIDGATTQDSNGDLAEVSSIHDELEQSGISDAPDDGKLETAENVDPQDSNENEKKELDLDEDVKNPQYIPKKGVFYEHDDRSHDVEDKKSSPSTNKKEDETVEVKETSANKKTTGNEKQVENRRSNRRQRTDADRWNHDLFKNEKQKPKSKSELINAYGYDIRQERGGRNQSDNRTPRTNNSTNNDRTPQAGQDGQRSRQPRDSRAPRQNQTNTTGSSNRSRERKPRRQNVKNNRGDISQTSANRRDGQMGGGRPARTNDTRDLRETLNEKHAAQEAAAAAARDQGTPNSGRNVRNDSRNRRRISRDRPANDEARLPPANTVMPPITTWSSEDMMKAEAFGKKSPPPSVPAATGTTITNNTAAMAQRDRPVDLWQQSQQPSKNMVNYSDRQSARNVEDSRHQNQYNNSRGRYQDRGDENNRLNQFVPRNQHNDRSNQHHEWHRSGNFSPYANKPTDYIVKTQTFENSRLAQANMNRANNNSRDLREVIDRRNHNQQNFQNKLQYNATDAHLNQRGLIQGHYNQQYAQSQHYMHPQQQQQQHMIQGQQHLLHQQHPPQHVMPINQQHQQPQQPAPRQQQPSPDQPQTVVNQTQQQPPQSNSQAQQPRQPSTTTTPATQPAHQQRQNLALNNVVDISQDSARLNSTNSNDLMNSRPIVKTDAYTGPVMPAAHQAQHSQSLSQHSQNHRSMSGAPMAQQGPAAGSHMVSSHLGAGATQPQYYSPSTSSRDPAAAAAALASAYHGYMPSGHSVMDPSRYHMTSQQLSDHGYITSSGQTNNVSGSVLHQQGLYTDTSAGGTIASSAYMGPTGSTLSPTSNIPVTGAGAQPLPPVSYIQHSQYPPPPYTNPYTQPQHNQAPPPTGHAYPPYWTYI